MKEFLFWLKEVVPLLIAFWSGKLSALKTQSKKKERVYENIAQDVVTADNTSDDDFIKLLDKKFK